MQAVLRLADAMYQGAEILEVMDLGVIPGQARVAARWSLCIHPGSRELHTRRTDDCPY